jgi:hypothetical protein
MHLSFSEMQVAQEKVVTWSEKRVYSSDDSHIEVSSESIMRCLGRELFAEASLHSNPLLLKDISIRGYATEPSRMIVIARGPVHSDTPSGFDTLLNKVSCNLVANVYNTLGYEVLYDSLAADSDAKDLPHLHQVVLSVDGSATFELSDTQTIWVFLCVRKSLTSAPSVQLSSSATQIIYNAHTEEFTRAVGTKVQRR